MALKTEDRKAGTPIPPVFFGTADSKRVGAEISATAESKRDEVLCFRFSRLEFVTAESTGDEVLCFPWRGANFATAESKGVSPGQEIEKGLPGGIGGMGTGEKRTRIKYNTF